jgi:hypothetical protein
MANKLFNDMNGQGNPLEQNFMMFMNQMKGQNPDQIIQQMVQSGKISQQQLNAVQQRAKQMSNIFGQFKSRFGF